jgi:hypothetical protein
MTITKAMLRDYLSDALPDAELAAIEAALRSDATVQARLSELREELDRGEHTLGAIWRRERLSCPSREQLGADLIGALDPEASDYIHFHLNTIGCPACQANVDDLKKKKQKPDDRTSARRQKIVHSSTGALEKAKKA